MQKGEHQLVTHLSNHSGTAINSLAKLAVKNASSESVRAERAFTALTRSKRLNLDAYTPKLKEEGKAPESLSSKTLTVIKKGITATIKAFSPSKGKETPKPLSKTSSEEIFERGIELKAQPALGKDVSNLGKRLDEKVDFAEISKAMNRAFEAGRHPKK